MPGTPPPEPTSTTGLCSRSTSSRPRSESSSSMRRATSRSRSAVSPGVATTASSQRRSLRLLNRADDDKAVRLGALRRRLDVAELLQAHVHDLPLDCRHRLELDRLAVLDCAPGRAHSNRLEHRAASLPVVG